MGVDFSLLWGLLAFLLNFIPNVGSIIAAIPAVLMALLQFGTTGALATLVVFVVVNTVIGTLLEPRIMGQRMNLSPLIVFVSLVFWGWLWGPLGMLLSVPLTMAIRIMLEGNEQTRPFAVLMAGPDASAAAMPTLRTPRVPRIR
jgi:predicted PurR-regulated permease PerM